MAYKNVLQACRDYLSVPYVWGGDTFAEGGFDCSGFVHNVLNDAGIIGTRTTAQGYYNRFAGHKADLNTDGALLLFGKSVNEITHIAINVGDGVHMYESIGNKSNTKYNKGKGVTKSRIKRRNDLIAIVTPFYSYVAKIPVSVLRYGSKGDNVVQLQLRLNEKFSAKLKVDGSYGVKTKNAVKAFQSAVGITADGIFGKESQRMLRNLYK